MLLLEVREKVALECNDGHRLEGNLEWPKFAAPSGATRLMQAEVWRRRGLKV